MTDNEKSVVTDSGTGRRAATETTNFVGGLSPAMQTLESVIAEIAPTNIPILLVGESGTGKERLARRIHQLSGRGAEAFVRIACAAANSVTLGAEIGLHRNGNGDASGSQVGTLFFDEISELDASCQRSLLYALPDSDAPESTGTVPARVISATNRNLDDQMRAGHFRSELYYRINGVCLRLPPLRERKEDIPLLVELFLTKHAAQFSRPRPTLSARTLRTLLEHSWPGNVRELENVVKKIVALGDERLAIAELQAAPADPRPNETAASHTYSLKAASRAASREAERELILKALAHTRWNRKRAAQELQISYKSLLYKLKQIGFEDSEAT